MNVFPLLPSSATNISPKRNSRLNNFRTGKLQCVQVCFNRARLKLLHRGQGEGKRHVSKQWRLQDQRWTIRRQWGHATWNLSYILLVCCYRTCCWVSYPESFLIFLCWMYVFFCALKSITLARTELRTQVILFQYWTWPRIKGANQNALKIISGAKNYALLC